MCKNIFRVTFTEVPVRLSTEEKSVYGENTHGMEFVGICSGTFRSQDFILTALLRK